MKKYTFILLFLSYHSLSLAQSVSGNWTSSVPTNTITEAGNNYSSNWTSLSNQTIISLPWGTNKYTVSISKTDINWPSDLILLVRKTGESLGQGGNVSPAGTTNYLTLTATNQTFFSSKPGFSIFPLLSTSFNVQYEIRGLSVTLPAQSYTTTVVYTISSP
jgi:hypothetical protein